MRVFFRSLPPLLLPFLLIGPPALLAADEPAQPAAVTTANPDIPLQELALSLVPFTKDELLVEATGWQALVRAKAAEIAQAEIAVQRQNQEIEQARDIEKLAQETRDERASVQTGLEAAKVRDNGGSAERPAEERLRPAAVDAADTLDQAAQAAQQQKKNDLLESLTQLREERILLVDKLRTVIDELQEKTDPEDSATMSLIKDYRLYVRGVSGINLDVTDATSTWSSFKGWLTSKQGGLRWAWNLAAFLGILIGAWMLASITSNVMRRTMRRLGWQSLLTEFLVMSVRWAILIVGLIWALAALEVSVTPLIAMLGAVAFIIAFAMQDSLSNIASGLMILFFRPFDMGDVVDAGGVSGNVSSMNLVSTSIKTFDNKQMIVPNNKIWADVITNATAVKERRVDMEFRIGYNDDIELAHRILEEVVSAHPHVLDHPAPTIKLNQLADSSLIFICRPWARTGDYWGVYWDLLKEVKRRFDAAGIGIPYPQRDVHLYLADDQARAIQPGQAAPVTPSDQLPKDGGLDDEDLQN